MSCDVLTSDRVERLLHRTLDEASRAALRTHFERPCEACLDRLASVDGEAILLALAGPQAELTQSEKDQIFTRAIAGAPVAAKPGLLERLRAFFASPPRLAFAGLAVVLLIAVPIFLRPAPKAWDGVKGSPTTVQKVELLGFVAADGAPPQALLPGVPMRPGEQLFLRFRLQSPAHVYLFAKDPTGAPRLLWKPEAGDPLWPAGEHELQQNGVALAVPLTHSTQLWAVAAGALTPALESLAALDEATIRRACGDCAIGRTSVELR